MSPVRDILAPMGASCALLAAVQLTVFAASSLREAFQELGRTFEQEHAGASVSFNFAGSQDLRIQIEHGARADVLAAADPATARALAAQGLAEDAQVFARNEPVIAVPAGNPAGIHAFTDLPRARRLVIGAPEVPIGAYTVQILETASRIHGSPFRAAVEARIASRELNVRQVLAKVALGEADAAIVYRTDALTSRGSVEIVPIPAALNVIAEYPIATLREAKQPALARAFVELVFSAEGRATLARYGFQ
jgi:molybdate transport system substrate-binding protein